MATWTEKDWTPVRRGLTYCSPACGGRCTWMAYEHATKQARKLSDRLGNGWEPDVWENLGWHYAAVTECGRIKVHPNSGGGYTAYLSRDAGPGGQFVDEAQSPRDAVNAVLKQVRSYVAGFQELVAMSLN